MNTKSYYLRSDKTITDNPDDINRVDGSTKTIYVEAETEEEMFQEALNEFKSNSYNHSVKAKLLLDSKLYNSNDLCVGKRCRILSETAGIKESMVTAVVRKESSGYIEVTFGNLPVTLTRKIRKEGGK